MYTFREFIQNIILENLHPELREIIHGEGKSSHKHKAVIKKIKDLAARGEKTGIEGNMPKGSARAYLPHQEPHEATVDGKKTSFKIGTKIAIKSNLDAHHDHQEHGGMSLGEMQNEVENGDHFVNSYYRILTKNDDGSYETNHENGIFPPLVEHDHTGHQWSTIGHSRDIKAGEFRKLTKTKTHPQGISHDDFSRALIRDHDRNNGKHWTMRNEDEKHLDHVEQHPLVQKFLDHQHNIAAPPHDYRQKKNLGIFEHPDGTKHIVARDHGFSNDVSRAYQKARIKRSRADVDSYNRRRGF